VVAKTGLRIRSCRPRYGNYPYGKSSELHQMISLIIQKAMASSVKGRTDNSRRFLRNLGDCL